MVREPIAIRSICRPDRSSSITASASCATAGAKRLADADLVIVGSYVPDGIAVVALVSSIATGIVAFYDIDTPVTLASLAAGDCPYLNAALIPGFDLYLSFTGGPALRLLERRYGARAARALYCSVDPDRHRPVAG